MTNNANSGFASARLIWQKRAAALSLEEQTASYVYPDMAYILVCSFGVFLITPAISLFYGGTLKRKNLVQLMFQSYMVTCVVAIIWYLIGYSLACSPTSSSKMLGNLAHAALRDEAAMPLFEGGNIPSVINFCFNVFFPIATVQIFLGSIGERGRILPSLVVAAVWVIAVYCPLAYWAWGANGWLLELGDLDFAGGGPVHIASGVASLCYSWFLGPRGSPGKRVGKIPDYRGHSAMTMFLGCTFIWAGWLFFNSGTLLAVNARTGYIFVNTILAACFSSLTYTLTDFAMTKRWSLAAACEGVILGLVNITPSCGFYKPWAAAITSIACAIICRLIGDFNKWTGIDDYSRSGVIHGLGGVIGGIFTGIFASNTITGMDGVSEIDGGWVDGHFVQLGYQLAAICVTIGWTAVFTIIILYIVDFIPGLKVRASPEGEEMGMDLYEMAETLDEFGNNYDDFFAAYANKLRHMADELEKRNGNVEVIDGISDTTSSVNVHQKV